MKIRLIHWLLLLWLILLVFQYDVLLKYFALWFSYTKLFITDFRGALDILNLKLIDVILAVKLFIVLPLLYFIFRKKWKFLQIRLNFSYGLLLILIWILIFAPIITNENPEFSKNLSVTKLLPPLSNLKVLKLVDEPNKSITEKEKFIHQVNLFSN